MSIRQTRVEYTSNLPTAKRKITRKMVLDLMSMRMKQAMRRRGDLPLKQPKTWEYSVDGGPVAVVYAFTRSQARAEIKAVLGIKKGRLPMGVVINEAQPASAGAA